MRASEAVGRVVVAEALQPTPRSSRTTQVLVRGGVRSRGGLLGVTQIMAFEVEEDEKLGCFG